ncbi:hypothetical protein [Parasitella parasitica]|uniref:Uncharacterized protein n=1 Tax=Parasitella parasitica TaxID=35722 RepID=A0A0B7NIS0_9FUNG|nr:hypothetical protein [Parasitella parasitica]
MTRVRSFEKHMNINIKHNIYDPVSSSLHDSSPYYPHICFKKGDDNSTSSNSVEFKVYPLTLENLSKIGLAEPSSTPLARYWSELSQISDYHESNISLQRRNPRRCHQRQDKVLESPRLLPFPYHNDSQFLPTAEHDYPGGCSSTDASSSLISFSVCTRGSRQRLGNQPSLTFSNRARHRQLMASPPREQLKPQSHVHIHDDNSITSSMSQKRRASSVTPTSPSTLHQDIEVPQKRRRSSNNNFTTRFKRKLLRFKSNSSTILEKNSCSKSYYSPSSSVVWTTTINDRQSVQFCQSRKETAANATTSKTSWLDKLWKLFRLQRPFAKRNRLNNATSTCSTDGGPVWYSQFRCNPPPPSGITIMSQVTL